MTIFLTRLSGALPSGERWSTGFHTSAIDTLADVLADSVTAAATFWSAVTSHYVAATTLDTVTVYELDPISGKATARAETAVSHVGTGTGSPLPQEVAVVASLRTATPGPKGRGRLYLPPPAVSEVTTAGRLTTGAQTALATGVSGMLSSMLGAAATPILFTKAQPDRTVISVDVGDVFDAQRRRRDNLVEIRVSDPVA